MAKKNRRNEESPASWALPFVIVTALGIVGVAILIYGFNDVQQAWVSRSWSHVQGSVVSYSVEERESTDSDNRVKTYYYPHIVYRYQVNEQNYTGNRIAFGDAGGDSSGLHGYYEEQNVTVYYSPDDPSHAVLRPGEFETPWWVLGIGVCFAGVGIPSALGILARVLRWLIARLNPATA